MGRPKQLLPWPPGGGTTVVASAFDAIAPACDTMIVVVGHEGDAVRAALASRPFASVTADPDAPMFESIRRGLAEAARVDPTARVLLHPADHPEVRPGTLDRLRAEALLHPAQAVCPEHGGRGGHPVLVPPAVAATIVGADGDGGLRRIWIDHPGCCRRIVVDDPGVVRDLDTPADYQ
jgi:molybdenum cofactor cytidylyltransferase